MSAWAEKGRPLQLVEQTVKKDDPDPKALACYGLMLPQTQDVWLRFVDGRPVSALTIQFLEWCCERLKEQGKKALVLVWDNAGWHVSYEVRNWLRAHNQAVKQAGEGVRIISCFLPSRSPWLNPIEPKWRHAKRKVVEPNRLMASREVAQRACDALGCPYEEHLTLSNKVA